MGGVMAPASRPRAALKVRLLALMPMVGGGRGPGPRARRIWPPLRGHGIGVGVAQDRTSHELYQQAQCRLGTTLKGKWREPKYVRMRNERG